MPIGQDYPQLACPNPPLSVPALQGVQLALLVAPVSSEAVPAGQGVHAEEPVVVVKVPEGHVKQAAADAEPLVGL